MKEISYKKTLNIPKTNFPMKGNLVNNENKIIEFWNKKNIYNEIKNERKNKKLFFLHDGPPYANGSIHIGHAVNKILKDIILKYKILSGFNVDFVPGWDCHGLPIEMKIKNTSYNNNFFEKCRNYVNNQIHNQKESFKRLGILADWNNSYITMNYNIQSNIINIFRKLLKLGYIKRHNKPVYWCIKCKSSLSELEIEYINNEYLSSYILFEIYNKKYLKNIFNIDFKNSKVFLISWTTTLWTLIDIQSLSLKKEINYYLVEYNNNFYITSKTSIKKLFLNKKYRILYKKLGLYLIKIICIHPITNCKIKIIFNDNIEENIGTSIVNIAPGHSILDYNIGIKNKLKVINNIDENGFYYKSEFINKKIFIFDVINIIKNILIEKNKLFFYKHINDKYQFCSRHKYPIIFRLTYQWFINLDYKNLRNKAIQYSEKAKWIPLWGKNKIKNMLNSRIDWCISRQRKWGVPIAVFINKKNNKIHKNTQKFLKKISEEIKKKGIEFWYKKKNKELFLNKNEYEEYFLSKDVLDVWFDSGCSILYSNLNLNKKKIIIPDLCLEGVDQYRGWFISTILIFTALKNKLPYKNVLTHGFVLDKKSNIKMSKSIGNVIEINDLLKKYGADIIRLWVAYSDYKKDIKISEETLIRICDIYKKIRNTIRFLLSNIYDFNEKIDLVDYKNMLKIDKWIINKLYYTQINIINLYENFNFHKIIEKIFNFCSNYLGSIYLEIIKDRQYTFNKNSIYRKSSQSAIFHILNSLIKLISPILSFTSEESWSYFKNLNSTESIFKEKWYNKLNKFNKNEIFNNDYWNLIFLIKKELNILIENEIKNKKIKTSSELDIILFIINDKIIFNKINYIKSEIKFILIVSEVKIVKIKNIKSIYKNNYIKKTKINNLRIKIIKKNKYKCLRCWNYYKKLFFNKKNNICKRCLLNLSFNGEKRKFV